MHLPLILNQQCHKKLKFNNVENQAFQKLDLKNKMAEMHFLNQVVTFV